MTRVLVTSVGGCPAIDVVRCPCRDATLTLVGADAGAWGRELGRRICDEVVGLPSASVDPGGFVDALTEASRGMDFVFLCQDPEIEAVARMGVGLDTPSALPPVTVLPNLLDKEATRRVARADELFPRTVALERDDVARAVHDVRLPAWLRPRTGSGGAGSLKVETAEDALGWISYWERRGREVAWVLHEYLPGRNLNWSGVFARGALVAAGTLLRHSYLLASVSPSGISGQARWLESVVDEAAATASERVVRALDAQPHGVYSVDLKEDLEGRPRVTEVNARLAGRPLLLAAAGVNLPLAALRALSGRDPGDALEPGGCRAGVHMYRQVDVDPLVGPAPREGADDVTASSRSTTLA